ncbi:hypothetical protein MKK75_06515 [Methylobacterium sp. J-030]|uniref:hypothetical protein n=1 Tax=Methylobacterium sp. J-030 TaxID=2836627 RepID=UPI001FBAB79D|nr:hypothetical protein [Methylobacterium sp. J-030]MCJ2068461.1 hypothetical protein [Methylobacterium sp. J-030]
MREALRQRLREISVSRSAAKNGVTGVTPAVTPPEDAVLHRRLHLERSEKPQTNQRCNTVAPVTPSKLEGGLDRYTDDGDTAGVTDRSKSGLQAEAEAQRDREDWFAHFEERAAIREFEGGFARAEAERLALDETIAALGPQPATLH